MSLSETTLQTYLTTHNSNTKLYSRTHAAFEPINAPFFKKPGVLPSLIARPQTAEDVQILIKYARENNVDFVIRTGGHDGAGRSQVHDALSIDMRDIQYVNVAQDRKTASVGGGILLRGVARGLGEFGLGTPVGSIATVGYVGWATLGGYGPFSARYGLGVDQIVGAKIVNPEGELVDANDEMLKGIRGGGGILGVIVELTVKVFPLKQVLHSTIVFESSDMDATWSTYTQGYQKLADEHSLPDALALQEFALELPGVGKAFIVAATWVDENQEEGNKWIDKIASLGNCIMKMTKPMTLLQLLEENEKLLVFGQYGRVHTLSFKKFTPKTTAILAKYTNLLPGGGTGISIHALRSPKPNEESVFGNRTDHHMLELISSTPDESIWKKADEWGRAAIKELLQGDPENMIESWYISLIDRDDTDLRTVYGRHYEGLLALKRKYDPKNVFKYAVPRLLEK
ncbi:FAD-binding domain-containing protein [Xylariaceae sp. FL1019]|nr:FAD-binding domain-containing protein [Xylariaceae sp. FL1019]